MAGIFAHGWSANKQKKNTKCQPFCQLCLIPIKLLFPDSILGIISTNYHLMDVEMHPIINRNNNDKPVFTLMAQKQYFPGHWAISVIP